VDELYQMVEEKINLEKLDLDGLGYPSWIPQWDSVCTSTLLPWDHDDRFVAASGLPLQKTVSNSPGRLVVKGMKIATIVEGISPGISSRNGYLDLQFVEHLQFKEYFLTEAGLLLLSKTLTARRTWYDSIDEDNFGRLADFCTHLVADFDRIQRTSIYNMRKSSFSNKGKKSSSKLVSRKWLRNKAKNGDADRYLEAAKMVCNNRELLLTSDERLGLGLSSMEYGDALCVPSGSDVPFILRPESKAIN